MLNRVEGEADFGERLKVSFPENLLGEGKQASGRVLFTAGNGRREYRCRFVRAGRIRGAGGRETNMILEAGALSKAWAAGLFDGKAVFVDHAGFFESPSLNRLAGVTSEARFDANESAIEGTITLYSEAEGIANLLDEILAEGNSAPDIGLSIVFWPIWAPRDNPEDPRRIVEIRHVESVDLVFEPAADGRILQALSSYLAGGMEMENEENATEQVETPAAPAPAPAPPATQLINQDWLPSGLGAWSRAAARGYAQILLQASGLPQASQDRLLTGEYATPEAVEAAIEAERAYLARLAEDRVIQLPGHAPRGGHISMGLTPMEQIESAVEAMLLGTTPPNNVRPLTGIRELYHMMSGDYEMTGVFQPDRVSLANVNSSTMAGLVANVLNKRVVNEFMQYPRWWEPFVAVEDFASLQDVKWITLGGVGELPTVAEGATYTELTWDDQTETSAFVKKGGYLGITLETIDKDDTGRVRAAPRALAQAAWLTLAKSVSAIFTSNSGVGPTMSDSLALFHATHANLGTTALSLTSYAAVRTAMRKQTELNSGERLGALTAPKFLLVPPDLEQTALQVLGSELDYTYALSNAPAAPYNVNAEGNAPMARDAAARRRVIVVELWTDTNNWAAVADPRLYPSIGIGYRYGRVPEIFSVSSPTAGLMFTNDTMPVKVRYFFACGPTDWRGLYKQNVA